MSDFPSITIEGIGPKEQALIICDGTEYPIILSDAMTIGDIGDYFPPLVRAVTILRLRAWADALESLAAVGEDV